MGDIVFVVIDWELQWLQYSMHMIHNDLYLIIGLQYCSIHSYSDSRPWKINSVFIPLLSTHTNLVVIFCSRNFLLIFPLQNASPSHLDILKTVVLLIKMISRLLVLILIDHIPLVLYKSITQSSPSLPNTQVPTFITNQIIDMALWYASEICPGGIWPPPESYPPRCDCMLYIYFSHT